MRPIYQLGTSILFFVRGIDIAAHILHALAKITFKEDCDETVFYHAPLWENSKIRRLGEPYLHHKLMQSPVQTLADLYDTNQKRFWSYNELSNVKGPLNFDYVYHRAIVSCIPLDEKPERTKVMYHVSKIKATRTLYWEGITKSYPHIDGTRRAWEIDMSVQIDKELWGRNFQDVMKTTNSIKLRFFQYNLVNRSITTNYYRSEWDNKVSPLCQLCGTEYDTVLHTISTCKTTKKLWCALVKWVDYYYKAKLELTDINILMNRHEDAHKKLIGTFILIMKQHIYVTVRGTVSSSLLGSRVTVLACATCRAVSCSD